MRLAVLALLVVVTQLCGCVETQKPDDALMPVGTPASWEGNMPGMSGMGTSNR